MAVQLGMSLSLRSCPVPEHYVPVFSQEMVFLLSGLGGPQPPAGAVGTLGTYCLDRVGLLGR